MSGNFNRFDANVCGTEMLMKRCKRRAKAERDGHFSECMENVTELTWNPWGNATGCGTHEGGGKHVGNPPPPPRARQK